MPTIRIDDEVYSWLKSQAEPFKDTPNIVLRRIAGLDSPETTIQQVAAPNNDKDEGVPKRMGTSVASRGTGQRLTGVHLSRLWNVDAQHALYHQDGTFYENLRFFPGALFDSHGYIIFETEQEYNSCSYLNIGQKLNVHGGIASIPGYKRMNTKPILEKWES
jgi:hypothetical protein